MVEDKEENKNKINNIVILIVFLYGALFLQVILFFSFAQRLDILQAWIFFSVEIIYGIIWIITLYKFFPKVLGMRSKVGKGSEPWEKILPISYAIVGWFVQIIVMAWDVGVHRWTNLTPFFFLLYSIIGYVLLVFCRLLGNWAMIENRHFEWTARIQDDKGHEVISTGPYKLVRHPGYLSTIGYQISLALIFGSIIGLIPALIASFIFVVRTYLEDKMLKEKLDGYLEYSKEVKYRLIPGIW
jgi:protein-S-isoprenylcysteine O-methyltransferase Ste14